MNTWIAIKKEILNPLNNFLFCHLGWLFSLSLTPPGFNNYYVKIFNSVKNH